MSTTSYEDYIERLLSILAKMLGRLLGLKEAGKHQEIKTEVNEAMKEYIGVELPVLVEMSEEEFSACVKTNLKNKPAEAELLADILKIHLETIEGKDEPYEQKIYCKLKALYEYAITTDRNYSMEREQKFKSLLKKIK